MLTKQDWKKSSSPLLLVVKPALENQEWIATCRLSPLSEFYHENTVWCSFVQERWQATENYNRRETAGGAEVPIVHAALQQLDMQGMCSVPDKFTRATGCLHTKKP